MYVALYISQLLLVSVATALLLVSLPRVLRLPVYSRFGFGFALGPHLVAVLSATAFTVLPGAPGWMAMSLPTLYATAVIAVIAIVKPLLLPSLLARFRRLIRTYWAKGFPVLILALSVPAIVYFVYILAQNAFRPAIGHDALIYLSEAKAVASTRSLAVLQYGSGAPDGSLPQLHPHTSLFTAFLAQSLLFARDGLGYPFDHATRAAFQFMIPLWILALASLAAVTRRAGLTPAVFLAFCLFHGFEYVSSAQSREAFRLIPLIFLVASLSALLTRGRWKFVLTIPAGIAAALSVHGHTLNLYFLLLIGIWFALAAWKRRAHLGAVLALGASVAIFVLQPLHHYIEQYLHYGNLMGQGMANFHMAGTPLMKAFLAQQAWGLGDLSLAGSLAKLLAPHGHIAAVASLAAIAIALHAVLWRRQDEPQTVTPHLLALLLLFVLVPLSNVFRGFAVDMKEAYLSNYRYAMVAFMLCPPLIALSFTRLSESLAVVRVPIRGIMVATLAAALAGGAFIALNRWTYYESPAPIQKVVDQDLEVCALARSLPAGHLWLTDRYSIAYFCDIRPTYLYTPHGRQFYATRDADEARALLESSRVGLVTFSNSIQEWWPSTALHASLLQQTGDAPELRKRVGYWEAFLLIR